MDLGDKSSAPFFGEDSDPANLPLAVDTDTVGVSPPSSPFLTPGPPQRDFPASPLLPESSVRASDPRHVGFNTEQDPLDFFVDSESGSVQSTQSGSFGPSSPYYHNPSPSSLHGGFVGYSPRSSPMPQPNQVQEDQDSVFQNLTSRLPHEDDGFPTKLIRHRHRRRGFNVKKKRRIWRF